MSIAQDIRMHWDAWAVILWLVLTAVVVGYEIYCVFNSSKTPPLTDVTVRYVPWWLILPFLTWLLLHFTANYLESGKAAFLRRLVL